MNRQKQIEEMAKEKTNKQWQIRDKYCLRIQKATQYKGDCDHEDIPSILVDYEKEIKKELIPENAVVMTREEYNNMQFVTEFIGTKQKIGACDFNRVFLQHERKIRKETAERIMNEISGDTLTISTRDYGSIEVVPLDRISEICENISKGDKQ